VYITKGVGQVEATNLAIYVDFPNRALLSVTEYAALPTIIIQPAGITTYTDHENTLKWNILPKYPLPYPKRRLASGSST
jgi:hypothetical protein